MPLLPLPLPVSHTGSLEYSLQSTSTVYSLQSTSTVYSLQSTVYSLQSTVYSLHKHSTRRAILFSATAFSRRQPLMAPLMTDSTPERGRLPVTFRPNPSIQGTSRAVLTHPTAPTAFQRTGLLTYTATSSQIAKFHLQLAWPSTERRLGHTEIRFRRLSAA